MPNKKLQPQFIQDAIADGEDILEKKKKAEAAKHKAAVAATERALHQAKIDAEKWAVDTLPGLVKTHTAKNERKLRIGSVEHESLPLGYGLDVLEKARLCKAMGLDIVEESFPADPGEEGMYACGAGYNVFVVW